MILRTVFPKSKQGEVSKGKFDRYFPIIIPAYVNHAMA